MFALPTHSFDTEPHGEAAMLLMTNQTESEPVSATVLMLDLEGYTGVAETLQPARLVLWLSEFLGSMAEVVAAHGGIVDQLLGDGLLAIFTDAEAAAECATVMSAALDRLNQSFAVRHLPRMRMRVGIHTGPVMASAIRVGAGFRRMLLGDTVNTAARLQSFADDACDEPAAATRVLISDSTRQALGPAMRVEFVGEVTLKGKRQPVTVWRLASPPAALDAAA